MKSKHSSNFYAGVEHSREEFELELDRVESRLRVREDLRAANAFDIQMHHLSFMDSL